MVKKVVNPGILLFLALLIKGIELCVCTNSTLGWIEGHKQITAVKLQQSSKDPSNQKSVSGSIEDEQKALMKLNRSFSDPTDRLSSWSGEDCCLWRGVTCHACTGHVIKLNLGAPYEAGFSAVEVDSGLAELKHLEYLDLSGNDFNRAQIPDFFGSFKNLTYLNLSHAGFAGRIPHQLGLLSKLRELDLRGNWLNGSIPQSFRSLVALEFLDLSDNQLSDSIPDSLGSLLALDRINLSFNQLNGSFPKSLLGLFSLTDLDLSSNQLSGHVPESIGQLVNLSSLDISSNSLDGVFSERHLANLSRLRSISIGANNLKCKFKSDWIPPFSLSVLSMSSCLIGPQFPPWIRTQNNIVKLDLSNSNIAGALPTWFQPMSISYLDLSYNQIIGNPIVNIADNMPSLRTLLLGNNMISGSIPDSLCKLGKLLILDLSENVLSSEIPRCWEGSQSLVFIDLSSNNLSGSIPNSFGNLYRLERLHVNQNNLQGELPQGLRNCTKLILLDLGENDISGSIQPWINNSFPSLRFLRLRKNMLEGRIPKEICDLKSLQFLDLAENNLIGDIPVCFGNLSGMIGTPLPLETMIHSKNSNSEGRYFDCNPYANKGSEECQQCRPCSVKSEGRYFDCNPYQKEAMEKSGDCKRGRPPLGTEGSYSEEWRRERLPVVTKGSDLEYTQVQLGLLANMDLSSNKLTGVIPSELCSLSGLQGLNLSNNQLSGNIPNQIGGMKLLETLDLSNNRLFGRIPQNLSALHSISHLNLSNNNLSGRVPQGNQLQTLTDPSIYGGNTELCGDPLPKKCGDSVQPPISHGHENRDNGEDKKKEKILFWFVVTTGYALGLWVVIGILVFKKNWRIAYFRFAEDKKEWILAMIAIKVARLKQRMQRT